MPDFLPSKDADLLAWMNNYSTKLTASGTSWGVLAPQSAAMAAAVDAFSDALGIATDPSTRTRAAIAFKDQKRTPMKQMARDLARIINAFPGMTNDVRISLGLNPRTGTITPSGIPADPPVLTVVSVVNRTVKVNIRGVGMEGRGKPANCASCVLMSYVGNLPPADIREFTYEGNTTRNSAEILFPSSVPAGARVWLTCAWLSPRDIAGQACEPIAAHLAGGATGVTGPQLVADSGESMKEAA